MTPAAHAGSTGGQSSAPTTTSEPRGSQTTARAVAVEALAEGLALLGDGAAAEVELAVEHDARRLAAGVGVDDPQPQHGATVAHAAGAGVSGRAGAARQPRRM